jgi:hypothetical protein
MRALGLSLAIAVAAGCGGSMRGTATTSAGEPRAGPPAAGVATQEGNPETPPVPQLLATLRFAHPESTMQIILSTFPRDIPPMAHDIRKFLRMGIGKMADAIALDRPLDMFVYQRAANPAVILTASLRDDVKPRADFAKFKLSDTAGGRFEVRPPHPFSTDLGAAKECEVDESARTISCTNAEGLLARTGPQRVARTTSKADAWIEVGREPIQEQILKDERREKASSKEKNEGRDFGKALAKSLFDDLRSIEAAASLSQSGASVSFTMNLVEGHSLIGKLLGSTAPAGPPPPRFFRLPVDSEAAIYTGGVDAEVWEPIKKEFVDSVVADSTKDTEYPEAILEEGRQALRKTFFTGGSWMLAAGNRPGAYRELFSDRPANRARGGAPKPSVSRIAKEWIILEVDEPGEKIAARAKEFLDFTRRADAAGHPKPGAQAGKAQSETREKWKADTAGIPPSLPKGTLHFASRATKVEKLRDEKVAETPHIFLVPEGDHTWIGYGEDEKTLVDHLKSVLEGQPKRGTLAAMPGIDALSSMGPLTGGGFWTLKILVNEPKETTRAEANALEEKLKYLDAVPSKGSAPYVFGLRRGAEGSPQLTIETKMSTRALQELVGYIRLDDSK